MSTSTFFLILFQVILMKIVKKKDITEEEALALTSEEVSDLIRSDPVTCMTHFDHRYKALLNLLMSPEAGLFAPYKMADYFSRLEFQMRGSPHSHGLYWIKDAPIYDEDNHQSVIECIKFIDMFITCERNEEGEMEKLIGYQIHKHSQTCKKGKSGKKCRFNYPKPPMEATMILTPLPITCDPKERKQAEEHYLNLQDKLNEMGRQFKEDIQYDEFLDSIGMHYNFIKNT